MSNFVHKVAILTLAAGFMAIIAVLCSEAFFHDGSNGPTIYNALSDIAKTALAVLVAILVGHPIATAIASRAQANIPVSQPQGDSQHEQP